MPMTCHAQSMDGFYCTRNADHKGQHEARGETGTVWEVWPSTPGRYTRCADCGCTLLRHPDEPLSKVVRCSPCGRKHTVTA